MRAYIFQILDGVKFLHSRNMTHGNLNSQNLLLDVYGVIKLSDYGNLNQLLETYAIKIISDYDERLYSEQIRNEGTNSWEMLDLQALKQNDILGIGCTVYEMVTGEVINSSNKNFNRFLEEIRDADQTKYPSGDYWKVSFELINFLQFIFDPDPTFRPTVYELFDAPFIMMSASELEAGSESGGSESIKKFKHNFENLERN